MSATPDSTLADPQQVIADLQRQLAASNAERDEAQQRLAEVPPSVTKLWSSRPQPPRSYR